MLFDHRLRRDTIALLFYNALIFLIDVIYKTIGGMRYLRTGIPRFIMVVVLLPLYEYWLPSRVGNFRSLFRLTTAWGAMAKTRVTPALQVHVYCRDYSRIMVVFEKWIYSFFNISSFIDYHIHY